MKLGNTSSPPTTTPKEETTRKAHQVFSGTTQRWHRLQPLRPAAGRFPGSHLVAHVATKVLNLGIFRKLGMGNLGILVVLRLVGGSPEPIQVEVIKWEGGIWWILEKKTKKKDWEIVGPKRLMFLKNSLWDDDAATHFQLGWRWNELEILEYFRFIKVSSLHRGATKKRGVISESVTSQWNRRNRYISIHLHLIPSSAQVKSTRKYCHRKQLDETTSHPLSGSGHTCPLIHPKKSAWQSCFTKHQKHQPSSYGPGRSSRALLFQHVIQSVQLPA